MIRLIQLLLVITPVWVFGQSAIFLPQCDACNSGLPMPEFTVEATGLNMRTHKEAMGRIEHDLKYNYNKPFYVSNAGYLGIVDDQFADAIKSTWLQGTGPEGKTTTPIEYDDFLAVNPTGGVGYQKIWGQKIGIPTSSVMQVFSFYAANLLDPNNSYNTGLSNPEIVIHISDASGKMKQIPFNYYTYDPNQSGPYYAPGPGVTSLELKTKGTGTGQFPEHLDGTNPTGLPWVLIETEPLILKPFPADGRFAGWNEWVYVQIGVINATWGGCDFGIDNTCLKCIDFCDDVTVQPLCESDNLDFSYTGTGVVQGWYVDGTLVSLGATIPHTMSLQSGSTLDNSYHNLKAGGHYVTAHLTNGTYCHKAFVVKGPNPGTSPQLEYKWVSTDEVEFDAWHDGESVEFWRYPTSGYTGGTQILPDANRNDGYFAKVDASQTEFYFCKIVNYGCGNPLKACGKICQEPFETMVITSTPTYNGTNGEFDVSFSVSNASLYNDFKWFFGDNSTVATTTIPSTTHTYSREGEYEVSVIAKRLDCPHDAAASVLTLCVPQDAALADVTDCVGYTNLFDADEDNDDHPPIEYSWSINGENLGTAQTQSIGPLNQPGEYELLVTKKDNCEENEYSATITINEPPNADFSYGMDRTNGLSVRFDADNANASDWKWYDVTPGPPGVLLGQGLTYTHNFSSAGTYVIKLEVTENGCTHELLKTICVQADPKDCCENCPQ